MNALTTTGHLTADPELKCVGESPVCEPRLAVDNGRYPPTFIDVRTFGEGAYPCAEYLHKNRKVGVTGRPAFEEWRTADNSKRHHYSVIGGSSSSTARVRRVWVGSANQR